MPKRLPPLLQPINACKLGICLLMCAFSFSTRALADAIDLKSGEHIEGKIIKVTDQEILLDRGVGEPITYYRDQVLRISSSVEQQSLDIASQADKLENQAVELIDEDKMDEGLAMFIKALSLDPTPTRHMNYGSILFGNGVSLFKEGKQDEALSVLHKAEDHLKDAIKGFDASQDAMNMSQCYFLLGEIYNNAFKDQAAAKTYYTKALNIFDLPAASEALKKLS